MDTQTLQKYLDLLNASSAKTHLVGVYASDRLPRRCNKPAALIAHTENASEAYGHWISIYVPPRGLPIYFDSFGLDSHVKNHQSFLARISKNYKYNTTCYQSPTSTVCGWWALMFLAEHMGVVKKGFFKRVLTWSKGNLDENDKMVEKCGLRLIEELRGKVVGGGFKRIKRQP